MTAVLLAEIQWPAVLEELLPWLAFVAVAGLVLAIALRPSGGPKPAPPAIDLSRLNRPSFFGRVTAVLAAMLPDLRPRKVQRDLLRCGFYWPSAYVEYRAIRNVLICGTALVAAAWAVALADDRSIAMWKVAVAGVVAVILAFSLPRLYVNWRGDRRAARIVAGFPDALDLMAMVLTGGLSLEAALDRTAGELFAVHPELALELEVVRQQTYAGSLEQALGRLARRVDEASISALTTLVAHSSSTGTDVTGLLRDYADQIRETKLERAEEYGNRASIQMLLPIVLCLAPAVYILLLAPPLLDLRAFRDRESAPGGVLSQSSAVEQANQRPPVQGAATRGASARRPSTQRRATQGSRIPAGRTAL